MYSLKVEEVQIKYDKQIIVKNISVAIAPQKITTIIGPNGCGKSTLLKAMSRILTCSSGDILLDGVSIFYDGYETVGETDRNPAAASGKPFRHHG